MPGFGQRGQRILASGVISVCSNRFKPADLSIADRAIIYLENIKWRLFSGIIFIDTDYDFLSTLDTGLARRRRFLNAGVCR